MRIVRARTRLTLTIVCLMASCAAVGLYAFRHFRLPSLAETFPHGELVIAIDPSYPPFGSIQNDQFVGLDVDLGQALAETLGLTPRFVMVNFDSAYDAVETGTAQLSLAALRVDNTRMADVAYTWGYLNDGVMLLSRTSRIDGWALGGARVGVELGSTSHSEARKWSRRVRDMAITPYDTPAGVFAALNDGSIDVALIDAISAREYLRDDSDAGFSGAYLTVEFYAGAVRSDRRDVLYHLNGAMLALLNDGTIDALVTQHVGPEPRQPRP